MRDIDEIVKKIDMLDPIPQAATRIMTVVDDPDSSVADVVKLVEYEPALTANLLKICNSAYFGLAREVTSVQHAVALLGMKQVADLIVMAGAAKNMASGQSGYNLQKGDLWRYSVSSALIARLLAVKKGLEKTNLVFTAALLKDMGKIVLDQYVEDSFDRINALVSKKGYTFMEAEQEIVGIDHATLGGMIAEKWKFNENMVYMISNHHLSKEEAKEDMETCLVYLADTICMMLGIGGGSDGLAYRFNEEVARKTGISPDVIQQVMAEFAVQLSDVEEMFNLV